MEIELLMARFEDLMERRPLLLNSVLLRQNPHNVAEWQKRVTLLEGKPHEIINTYTEAVQTVQPNLAVGKLHHLWINFAKFYEENKQMEDARIIFEKATHVAFLKVGYFSIVLTSKYVYPYFVLSYFFRLTISVPSGASGSKWS